MLGVDLDEALRRFEEDRTRLVGRLRELRPEDWARAADHEEYNSYSVLTMCRHLALHDFFHAYRIEELLLRKDWPAPDVLRIIDGSDKRAVARLLARRGGRDRTLEPGSAPSSIACARTAIVH